MNPVTTTEPVINTTIAAMMATKKPINVSWLTV